MAFDVEVVVQVYFGCLVLMDAHLSSKMVVELHSGWYSFSLFSAILIF